MNASVHGMTELYFCQSGPSPRKLHSHSDLVEALYIAHHASLCRFIMMVGCPSAIAPELVQETFLRLFEQLRAGQIVEHPRAWLIRVLYRLWLNHVRKHRRESALEELSPHVLHRTMSDSGRNPVDELLFRQRVEAIAVAMRQLSSTQFRYLVMRAEGLKFREIAEAYGVSISAVAEAYARGIERLRLAVNTM